MNNEYEEANVYVDEEVNKHKKKTSAYMDAVKFLVFISLLSNLPNFKDKFKELTEKYNLKYELPVERSKFNIFEEWENITENGFMENYCLSKEEKLIFNIINITQ